MVDGVAGGSAAGGDLDFAIDRGEVVVDCARTDHQLFGDLGIGQSRIEQIRPLILWSLRGRFSEAF